MSKRTNKTNERKIAGLPIEGTTDLVEALVDVHMPIFNDAEVEPSTEWNDIQDLPKEDRAALRARRFRGVEVVEAFDDDHIICIAVRITTKGGKVIETTLLYCGLETAADALYYNDSPKARKEIHTYINGELDQADAEDKARNK